MGWGDYWNPTTKKVEGFKPIKGPEYEINENQIGSQSYWKVKNNPMYKAAADALGVDWDEFIADADASVGLEEDWEDYEPETETFTERKRTGRNTWTTSDPVTYNVTAYEAKYKEWSEDEDSDIFNKPKQSDFPLGSTPTLNQYGFAENKDIFNQIQEFDGWLNDTSKLQGQHEIIREGPKPSDYGMEGDNIFSALGIDKAPEAPKELDVSYEMDLAEAKPSDVTYHTPAEYSKVNLHE
tara:strand:- start:1589 stop:2305 length:717 start_codon:yes stop_codon:yes gene_type:complete